LQSRPLSRPSSSRSLVAVQDEEDVRLHWARKVAKKCEKFEKKKSKKRKKGKSTRELIKENEEMLLTKLHAFCFVDSLKLSHNKCYSL
jgi:type I site-specific restriction endonuclease